MTNLPTNEFGINLPLDDLDATVAALGIQDGDRVLDVGGGGNAFPRADVVCDFSFGSCAQRNGAQGVLRADVEYVEAPAEKLPFEDDSFDFIWSTQTLEHVVDPDAACREFSRVARRGFVEVPSRVGEMMYGNPTHRWICDREGDTLVFHPRPFVEHPLLNAWYGLVLNSDQGFDLCQHKYRNILNHQILFEGTLGCRVVAREGDGFNYDDPGHAARSHYDFARNTLIAGTPADYGFPDILEVVRLIPDSLPAQLMLATYQIRLLRLDDARRTLEKLGGSEAAALMTYVDRLAAGEPIPLSTVPIPGPNPFRGSEHGFASEHPLVSIVLAGDDPASLVASAEACLTQDYPKVQVVVACAGAPGGGFARLSMPERLSVIEQPEGTSLGTLFNKGAAAAAGEVLAFILGGDRPFAHHVERTLATLLVGSAEVVYTDRLLADGTVAGPDIVPGDPGTAAASLSTVVARRSALEKVGWFEADAEDAGFDYLIRLARTLELHHVREATIESPRAVPHGAHVLDAARSLSRLRPLELHRALIAATEREAGLRSRIADLEARLRAAGGDGHASGANAS